MASDLDLKIRISAELADMKSAIAGLRKDFDSIGSSAKSASTTATSGMQGVSDAIDDIVASLRREADLFGKSAQEVKLYELAMRGATQAEMAEAKAIVGTIDSLKRKQAAERDAAAAEANRQASIKQVVAGLNQEVAALGKTSKELTLYKLQQLGATDAEMKHARSLIEQKEAFERVNGSAGTLNGTLRSLAVSAAAFFSVQGAIQATSAIARITDDYQNMASRLRIATGEGEAFTQTQQALFAIAQKTSTQMAPLVDLYTSLERSTRGMNNVSREQIIRLTEIIGKYRQIADMGPGADAAIMQLGQALSSNFANASQEINSIIDQLPAVADALARSLGLDSAGQLKKFAEEGKLTSEIFVNAMLSMGDEADAQSAKIADTVGKAMTRLRNDVTQAVGQSDMQPLIDSIDDLRATLTNPATMEGLQLVAGGIANIASVAVAAVAAVGDLGQKIGFMAAQITGNITPLDELEQKIKDVDKAIKGSWLDKPLAFAFKDKGELEAIKAQMEAQRDALLVSQGGLPEAERKAREAAAIEEKNRKLKEQAEAELAAAQAAATKKQAEEEAAKAEEKRQRSIKGILDNLTEQAATEGRSAEEAVNYQLAQLGASDADLQRAAALSQQVAAIKAKGEADKEAQKRAEEAAKADEKAAEVRKKLLEDVARDTEQLQIELLRMEGKGAEARTREIEIKYRDMMNRMKQAGDENGQALVESLMNKQKVQAQFDDVQQRFDKLLRDLAAKEESLANRVRIGDMTQSQADAELDAERGRVQTEGAGLIREQEIIAAGDPELALKVDENTQALDRQKEAATGLKAAYGELDTSLLKLKEGFATAITQNAVNGLTTMFTNIINGTKSAKEALTEFVRGFIQSMIEIAARAMATYLVLQTLDAIYPGLGKAAAATMGVGQNHYGGIAGRGGPVRRVNPALFAAAPRYHTGGVAGLKPGEVPAILKKGEEVLTERDPRHVANGGGQGNGVRIINTVDPGMVADYMSSSQGEEVFLNVIQRNSGSIKQAILGS